MLVFSNYVLFLPKVSFTYEKDVKKRNLLDDKKLPKNRFLYKKKISIKNSKSPK